MSDTTPNNRAARRVAPAKARRAAVTVAIDVQTLDDAEIEAAAAKLADLWDAGVAARVEFACDEAICGTSAPMGRLPNDVRRSIARFDAAMQMRGYNTWIDRVCRDASQVGAGSRLDDRVRRTTLRSILELFEEDTMRHTRPRGRRYFQSMLGGDGRGDPVIDLILSTEQALAVHADRIAIIDRALASATPAEESLLRAAREVELKTMLDMADPGNNNRAALLSLAASTFCTRAAAVKAAEEAQPWIEIGERILEDADLLTPAQLKACVQAANKLLVLTKPATAN